MNRRMLGYVLAGTVAALIFNATSCAPKSSAKPSSAPAVEKSRANVITVSKVEYSKKFQAQQRAAVLQMEETTPDNRKAKRAILKLLDAEDPDAVKQEMAEALKVSLRSLTNDPLFKQHPDISLNGIIREDTARDENGKFIIDQFIVVELSLPRENGKPVRVASLYFNGEDLGAQLDTKKSYGTNLHPEKPSPRFENALNDITGYCKKIDAAIKTRNPNQTRRIVSLDNILCLG